MTALTGQDAARLLRRVGFGSVPEEIDELLTRSREGAVDFLLDYDRVNHQEMKSRLQSSFEFLRAATADQLNDSNFNETEIRAWWLTRIHLTRRPLEEKMALFRHHHFAASTRKAICATPPISARSMPRCLTAGWRRLSRKESSARLSHPRISVRLYTIEREPPV